MHLTIIKVRSHHIPLTTVGQKLHTIQKNEELPIKTKQLLWEEEQGLIQQKPKVNHTDIKQLHDRAVKI